MSERIKNCELVNEIVNDTTDPLEGAQPLEFSIACNQTFVPYESLFRSTCVTGTLVLEVFDSTCTFTVTVERHGQPTTTYRITPTDTNRTLNLAVDHLKRITFSCSDGSEGFCSGEYTLLLNWCKCC